MVSKNGHHKTRPGSLSGPALIAPPLDGGYGWVVVLTSFLCNMIVDGIPSCFGLFLSKYAATFHEETGTVTFAQSVNVGMHLLVGPLVGVLCKRYSCRAVCCAGSILCTVAFLLSTRATSTLSLSLIYGLLGGIGFGMIYISTVILVSYYFELRRSLAVSISICGTGFGSFFFPLLCHWLLRIITWQQIHLIFALSTAICSLLSLLLLPLEHFRPLSVILSPAIPQNTAKARFSLSKQQTEDNALTNILEDDHDDDVGEIEVADEAVEDVCSTLQVLPNASLLESVERMPLVLEDENSQSLYKGELQKILLLTRIVLKKDGASESNLPLLSRRLLNAMENVRETSGDEDTLEYELLDFYEIKRSKSEDLTLLQRYIKQKDGRFIALQLGDSLPSNLNQYAYVLSGSTLASNDIKQLQGLQAGNARQHEKLARPTHIMANYSTTESVDHVMYAANRRNIQSLPLLDFVTTENPGVRMTQSIHTLTDGGLGEHERFMANLWNTSKFWTSQAVETAKSFKTAEKASVPDATSMNTDVTSMKRIKRRDCPDSAWWNSSSSVRKDMYYTGSIRNLKEYQEEKNEEEYRKQNTVQVSLLEEMWDTQLLTNRLFLLYIFSNVFLLAGFYIPSVFLVDTAVSKGIASTEAPILISVMGLANMVGRLSFGILDDKNLMDSLLLNNISLLVSGLSILGFVACSRMHEFLFASVVLGFSQACAVCLTTTLLVRFFSLDKLTSSFGILQMFRGVAIMLGVPCGGLIYGVTKSYPAIYWVSVGFYAVSFSFSCVMHFVFKLNRKNEQKYERVVYLRTKREESYGC